VSTPVENMLSWQIDILVGPKEHRQGKAGPKLADRLKDVAPYRYLDAYKKGRVMEIPGALFAATSHKRIDAYEVLAKALHPEKFRGNEGERMYSPLTSKSEQDESVDGVP